MLNYPWLLRSVYVQRVETLKQSGLWSSLGITLQNNRILTKLFCTSGPNLVILAWTDDELSHQKNSSSHLGKIWFWSWIWLDGQERLPLKTIGTLTKVFCAFGPNLVILVWTGCELSRGRGCNWHMDGHADTGNDNAGKPKLALSNELELDWCR